MLPTVPLRQLHYPSDKQSTVALLHPKATYHPVTRCLCEITRQHISILQPSTLITEMSTDGTVDIVYDLDIAGLLKPVLPWLV